MAAAGSVILDPAASRAELAESYAELYDTLRRCAAEADSAGALPDRVLSALRSSGILGAAVGAEYGGHGGGALLTNRIVEQVAGVDPSVAIILFQHYEVGARIAAWGTAEQRKRCLPRLASGEWIAASAWSDSGAGADRRTLATRAVRADSSWVLDGARTFTTGAGLAQVYLVLARSAEPTAAASTEGGDGQTFFLVESDNPGLAASTGMDLVGMRASATGFVELDSCRVEDSAVLGPLGGAAQVIASVRESGTTLGAVSVGIADTAYRLALSQAQRRGGLEGQQAVRFRLADLAAQVAAARSLVDSSARRDTAEPGNTTLYSKLIACQIAEAVLQESLRLVGSAGFLRGHALNKLARDARAVALMGPTNDLCRELVSTRWE